VEQPGRQGTDNLDVRTGDSPSNFRFARTATSGCANMVLTGTSAQCEYLAFVSPYIRRRKNVDTNPLRSYRSSWRSRDGMTKGGNEFAPVINVPSVELYCVSPNQ